MTTAHEQVRTLIDEMLPQINALAKRAIDNAAMVFQMKADVVFKELNEKIAAIPEIISGSCKPVYYGLEVKFETNILYKGSEPESTNPSEESAHVL